MAISLSPQEWGVLKNRGYSDVQIQEAVSSIEREELGQSGTSQQKSTDPRMNASYSSFYAKTNENDIRWQLELNDILEKTEHILRGDVIEIKNGQMNWVKNDNLEHNALNEYGVQRLMSDLVNYINRHIILGDYDEKEINEKVYDYSRALTRLIFTKYEEFGMNTDDKRKEYPMIVLKMKDAVHGAYARAKFGGERRSLKEIRQITQTDQIGGYGQNPININTAQQPKTRGLLNPLRYVKGKYV